jgi:hypothetical protein
MPLVQVIEKLPLPSNRRFRYGKEQLDAIIYRIINDHHKMRIANETSFFTDDNHHDDLISTLRASDSFGSSGSYIIPNLERDNVMTIFLACRCINMDILPSIPKQ